MNDESKRILKMVSEGRISAEQAEELLDALGSESGPGVTSPAGAVSSDELLGFAALGVGPGYVAELRTAGLHAITSEDAMGLAALGVGPEYVTSILTVAPGLSIEQISGLAALGVDPGFVEKAMMLDGATADIDQVMGMFVMGVDPTDAERFAEAFDRGRTR
jgi:hypothetical protein